MVAFGCAGHSIERRHFWRCCRFVFLEQESYELSGK
nr:MAG TPA: Protein of unknown function (DUF3636) [Caudoviricetes sp.]